MSESFEKLQNRILSDARVKAEDIIREAEEKAGRAVDEARAGAQREAGALVSKARLDADVLRRSILSSKVRSNRLRILEEKNRIVQSVLHSVEERLSTVGTTDNFQNSLKKMVSEALEAVGPDQAIVRVGFPQASKKDFDSLAKSLAKGAKMIVEDRAIDELGGVVASDADGRVIYNNSFRARIDRFDTQLLSLISSSIFGE